MRTTATICFFAALFGAGWSVGTHEHRNGAGWTAHSGIERMMYANGYSEGYLHGSAESAVLAMSMLAQKYKLPRDPDKMLDPKKLERMRSELEEQVGSGRNKKINTLEIEKGMDAFYADFRNQSVCWADAFRFSAMSLNGDSAMEEELAKARSAGAESGCE